MGGIIPIVDRLNQLSDSRSDIHVTYSLAEVIFIVYASILSGHNKWQRMEKFAKKNKRWFRKFFPYRWGMPTHYTIRKICMLIDPEEFEQLFVDWMHDVIQEKKGS